MIFNKIDYISKEKALLMWYLVSDRGRIQVETPEEAEELLVFLDYLGYKWIDGCSLLEENRYYSHIDKTYYRLNSKFLTFGNVDMTSDPSSYLIQYSSNLLEKWKELENKGRIKHVV